MIENYVHCVTFSSLHKKGEMSRYLVVRLRFVQVTRLCCLVAADFTIDGGRRGEAVGLGGGQELYGRGNQASLVPHGQQGIVVL